MYTFEQLCDIMARLRTPGTGCPWDLGQTHESIKDCLLEEAYEFLEAVEDRDDRHMEEELGDVLLQVVFHARMAEERGAFGIGRVIHGLAEKLVRRHPHVFGELAVHGADEVMINWETIKFTESGKEERTSRMDGIPRTFPALARARKIQKRAARDGFDWQESGPVFNKIQEELGEVREALAKGNREHIEEEMGDLLFAVVNLARKLNLDAESALARANRKFERRYRDMEQLAHDQQRPLDGRSLEELDALWLQAKTRTG